MGPYLRQAAAEDVPQLLQLEGLLFDNSMSEPMLVKELEIGTGFVYHVDGVVHGYALVRQDGNKLDLTRLGVAPEWQGGGIGRALVERVLCLGKAVVLTVKKKNYRAIKLYRHYDFEIIGQLNEHAAWAMRRAAGPHPASAPSDGPAQS